MKGRLCPFVRRAQNYVAARVDRGGWSIGASAAFARQTDRAKYRVELLHEIYFAQY